MTLATLLLAALCLELRLEVVAAVDCVDGWQPGFGIGETNTKISGTRLRPEDCAKLVKRKCPHANGATQLAIGGCLCEFGMKTREDDRQGSMVCLFYGRWKKDTITLVEAGIICASCMGCCCCCCLAFLFRSCIKDCCESCMAYVRFSDPDWDDGDSDPKKTSTQGVAMIGAKAGSLLPDYWNNQDIQNEFDTRCPPPMEFQVQLQMLLDKTFKDTSTRDRTGRVPASLRLLECIQVENRDLWARYLQGKARIAKKRPDGCTLVGGPWNPPVQAQARRTELAPRSQSVRRPSLLSGDRFRRHSQPESPDRLPECSAAASSGMVKTSNELEARFRKRLDDNVNELYLWHGTTPEGAFGILDEGFKLSFVGSHRGTMFGKGIYFAECSSKSDEYSQAGEGQLAHIYGLLLCRVACGELFRLTKSDHKAVDKALSCGEYDSILGDREASVGTYREFVVFSEDVIYPEYVILYQRRYMTE